MKDRIFCITGIDTDIGKTVATGLIAKSLLDKDIRVITQKIAQTGCINISEDIVEHRRIMGVDLYDVDRNQRTCPYLFSVPCSPHLAAEIDGERVDIDIINRATESLLEEYDVILLEGVGGLSVPLNDEFTLLDYLEKRKYPLILVSGSRLGSINHTLNALELARTRKLEVVAIIYNRFGNEDVRIEQDSKKVFKQYMEKFGFNGPVIEMGNLDGYESGADSVADLSGFYDSHSE